MDGSFPTQLVASIPLVRTLRRAGHPVEYGCHRRPVSALPCPLQAWNHAAFANPFETYEILPEELNAS